MNQVKQFAEATNAGPVVARLLGRQSPSLSCWYGDPVSKDVAQTLTGIAQYELRCRLCEGGARFQLHVLLLVCHFWAGRSIELDYEQLAASTRKDRERALLELVYGQLLISCKYRHALRHLGSGFSLAVDYLDSADYFRLVRQHELLEYLPVSSRPSPPLDLESLLIEAGVIRCLQTGTGRHIERAHRDTVG